MTIGWENVMYLLTNCETVSYSCYSNDHEGRMYVDDGLPIHFIYKSPSTV
jgi:hypothetical protein